MLKILAIDNNRENLVMLSALLKKLMSDCVLITAQSGEEGLEQALAEPPDVILLDIHQPGSDGFETCRRLKAEARTRDISVIMIMDIRTDAASRIKGLEIGVDAFLSKPIDESELLAQLKVALRIKRAEAALREAEQWLQVIINHSPAVIYLKDTEGRFLLVNHEFERIFHLMQAEVQGKTDYDFMPQALADRYRTNDLHVLATGKSAQFEESAPLDDGEHTVISVKFPLYQSDGTPYGVCGISTDITERKQAEEALRESEERYHQIALSISDIAYSCRHHPESGFRIEWVVGATNDLIGYTQDEFRALVCWGSIVCEEDFSIFERHVLNLPPGESSACELRLRRRDGDWMWVAVYTRCVSEGESPQIPRLFGALVDITERKQAEEALRESEARFKALHDASFGGIAIHEKGDIIECNKGLSDISGYTKNELLSMDGMLLIAEQSRKTVMANILAGYEKPYEAVGLRKNGEEYPIRLEARNVLFRGKKVRTVEFRDITEQKQAEAEKEKLQAQLIQAQKMESVGRLAGGVAHDFNNMLSTILGYTEMALERVAPALPLYAELTEIRKAAERSADITRQLLAFARKQTIAPKVLDLNETVTSMLKMLARLIGEDIDLAWKPGYELWPVKMDPSQIDRMLANLCVNARDAIADVGKVTIETRNIAFDEDYCARHAGFIPGEFILLAVSDSGCGMDAETQSRLFEPFFTTKEMGKGTGLGLATIYGIVKQNNGFINVYSEPGEGTTFKIYLPRHNIQTAFLPKPAPVHAVAHGNETILLVEDEPGILKMIFMMLERLGYVVLEANTPGEAIRLAQEHPGRISLLMTDVIMPKMNGRDLAQNLMSLYPDLKCLFMSGYTANVIAHHGVLDEGVRFIQKPFSKRDLAAKLREALEE